MLGQSTRTRHRSRLFTRLAPAVLAIAGNSPWLLGHRLWHETRVPLFKQSIDGRDAESRATHLPARVDFGHGWVREGAFALFAQTVYVHEPILPICGDEAPLALVGVWALGCASADPLTPPRQLVSPYALDNRTAIRRTLSTFVCPSHRPAQQIDLTQIDPDGNSTSGTISSRSSRNSRFPIRWFCGSCSRMRRSAR